MRVSLSLMVSMILGGAFYAKVKGVAPKISGGFAPRPPPSFAPHLIYPGHSRAIGFLKHAKTFLRQETLMTLCTGFVEPHFRYCCSVWGCAGTTELNQFKKLQNRAARIITNSSFDTPSRPLIDQLGWKTIEQLVASESKTMVFKSLHELAPQYLCDLFTRNSKCSSYVLCNSETDLRLPMKKSSNGQKCFCFYHPAMWGY